jgi:hypothetical protein
MDDPEIWSAIHRMANVLERLHGRAGVVMDGKEEDRKREKLQNLLKIADDMNRIWAAMPTLCSEFPECASLEFTKCTPTDILEDSWTRWCAIQQSNSKILGDALKPNYATPSRNTASIHLNAIYSVYIPENSNSLDVLLWLSFIYSATNLYGYTPGERRPDGSSMDANKEISVSYGTIDHIQTYCTHIITKITLLKIARDMNTIWGAVPILCSEFPGCDRLGFELYTPSDISEKCLTSWCNIQERNMGELSNTIGSNYATQSQNAAKINLGGKDILYIPHVKESVTFLVRLDFLYQAIRLITTGQLQSDTITKIQTICTNIITSLHYPSCTNIV